MQRYFFSAPQTKKPKKRKVDREAVNSKPTPETSTNIRKLKVAPATKKKASSAIGNNKISKDSPCDESTDESDGGSSESSDCSSDSETNKSKTKSKAILAKVFAKAKPQPSSSSDESSPSDEAMSKVGAASVYL